MSGMRPGGPMGRPGGGGPMGGVGVSTEKAQDFRGSMRRFSRRLRPERWIVALVLASLRVRSALAARARKALDHVTAPATA